ncbi:MAG: hypothetical protein IJY22_02590 [Clostridia bacterium]|nr:hypothetical protein [Clostridia bacterium]
MKTVRILALILALLMLAMTVVACDETPAPQPGGDTTPPVNQPGDNDDTTPPEDEQPPEDNEDDKKPEETVLQLVDTGVTEYVIIRDYKASQAVVDAITSVVAAIKEDTGATITVRECFNDRPEETMDVETEKEILIGMTNRAESQEALGDLLADDFTIAVHGSKLVVGGGGDSGTLKALAILLNQHIHEKGNKYEVKNGRLQSIAFSSKENVSQRGTYSYSSFVMLNARIDSYYLFFPKGSEMEQTYKQLAEELSTHIATTTGYELDVYKDTRAWADYEILIGDTIRTPEGLYEELADDEYVIQLVKTEVTYEDGSVHEGAQLYICFGEDAYEAVKTAFTKEFMPASTVLLDKNVEEFVLRGNA